MCRSGSSTVTSFLWPSHWLFHSLLLVRRGLFMLCENESVLDATSRLDASQRSFGLGLGLDLVCLPCPSSLYAHKKKRRRLREILYY